MAPLRLPTDAGVMRGEFQLMFNLIGKTFSESKTICSFLERELNEVDSYDFENTFHCYTSLGVEVLVDDGSDIVTMIVLHPKSNGIIDNGNSIDFKMSRLEIENVLGPPEKYFERTHDKLLGDVGSISRYNMNEYLMFLEYSEDESSLNKLSYTQI